MWRVPCAGRAPRHATQGGRAVCGRRTGQDCPGTHPQAKQEENVAAGMKPAGAAKRERRRGAPPPRVVLDTNVVLSALLFGGGPVARVRAGWQAGLFVPLASTATAARTRARAGLPEVQTVSQRSNTSCWPMRCRGCRWCASPDPPPTVPACRDQHDLPFLQLAVAGQAKALVSGDRDLLSLAGARGICPILSVDAFCRRFWSVTSNARPAARSRVAALGGERGSGARPGHRLPCGSRSPAQRAARCRAHAVAGS